MVSGRRALPFGACVRATNSAWQWDHQIARGIAAADMSRALAGAATMGYSYELMSLAASGSSASSIVVSARVVNRGVAPAYYPVLLTLGYPCGGPNTTIGDVAALLPGRGASVFTSSAVARIAGETVACVFLTSPRALRGVRFAIEEADGSGVVRIQV